MCITFREISYEPFHENVLFRNMFECIHTCRALSVRTVWLTTFAWLMFSLQQPQQLKFLKVITFSVFHWQREYFPSLSSPRSFFLIQLRVSQPVFFTLGEAKTSHRNLSKSQHSPHVMSGPPQLWWLQRRQWLAGHNNNWWKLEGRVGSGWESMNGKIRERNILCRRRFACCCIVSCFYCNSNNNDNLWYVSFYPQITINSIAENQVVWIHIMYIWDATCGDSEIPLVYSSCFIFIM